MFGRLRLLATCLTTLVALFAAGSAQAADSWSPVDSMDVLATWHTATALADGTVLVTGGQGSSGRLASAELYDPVTGTWSPPGQHGHRPPRTGDAAADGRCSSRAATRPASASRARSCTTRRRGRGPPGRRMSAARARHTATLLPTARCWSRAAERLLDRSRARSCTTRRPRPGRHRQHERPARSATRRRCCRTARCWSPAAQASDSPLASRARSCTTRRPARGAATGSLATARGGHTATLLPNGKVLVAGG